MLLIGSPLNPGLSNNGITSCTTYLSSIEVYLLGRGGGLLLSEARFLDPTGGLLVRWYCGGGRGFNLGGRLLGIEVDGGA